ncbi:MAG: BLUF domain-containing protein [Mucilaginibacter sp.]|uniref:BLUF domain-containing protein n=1 Tax=Mucilaginibacter sp. TaxID=1882438 RepID=UPI0034E4FEC1
MYFLVYTSTAASKFSDEQIEELMVKSIEKNKALSITGLLLFFDGKFMQLLEGEEKETRELYNTICKDERHKDVLKIKEGYIENRFCKDWKMCFKHGTYKALAGLEGYRNMSDPSRTEPSCALKMYSVLTDDLPFYVPY